MDKSKKPKLKNEEFIERSNRIHNNKYDYSEVNYTGCRNKIKIICPIHGEFMQQPYIHLQGHGCFKCMVDSHFSDAEKFEINSNKIQFQNACSYNMPNSW